MEVADGCRVGDGDDVGKEAEGVTVGVPVPVNSGVADSTIGVLVSKNISVTRAITVWYA
jgi:hypothetical protein